MATKSKKPKINRTSAQRSYDRGKAAVKKGSSMASKARESRDSGASGELRRAMVKAGGKALKQTRGRPESERGQAVNDAVNPALRALRKKRIAEDRAEAQGSKMAAQGRRRMQKASSARPRAGQARRKKS